MALSGVEIFKLLPKTNCKKCGQPTCLAFAMKLAQRQASLDACPDVSEESKKILGDASAPPVRPISFGTGEKAVKMGEETVLFRHEKKFVNPCAFAVEVKDTMSEADIASVCEQVINSEIDRVGQKLKIDSIAITNESGDTGKLEAASKTVAAKAAGVPVIINTTNAQAAEAAVKVFVGGKPVIYGANAGNLDAMAAIAKNNGAILGIAAANIEELSVLTEKAKGMGVEDLVVDSGARAAKDIIGNNTLIRRAAIKKSFKPLGYPIINFAQRECNMTEALVAGVCVAKYASIVVLSSVEKWKNLALFTLRQNIYTDPQVPMQVEQKIYNIGEPKPDSPILITTNFSLTYFIVSGEIESCRIPCRLAVIDAEGLSVLTAWAAGKFSAGKIAAFITESGLDKEISKKELVIPGYVAILSGAIEDKLPDWKITVGPREANAIPTFLKSRV
jgi:acetyl-CoA decarbonylase/synthase, CODH/ACS complex subunit gamma